VNEEKGTTKQTKPGVRHEQNVKRGITRAEACTSAALTYGFGLWEINSVNNTLNGSFSFRRQGQRTHQHKPAQHSPKPSIYSDSMLEEVLQTGFIHARHAQSCVFKSTPESF
jgi:hypothetical protein